MMMSASLKWELWNSDVSTAFLRGEKQTRELYVEMPAVIPEESVFDPKEILRILKGLYGLPEAPRLWWLAYRKALIKLGFKELSLLPGVFVLFRNGEVVAFIALHVDDGIMSQAPGEKVFDELRNMFPLGTCEKRR